MTGEQLIAFVKKNKISVGFGVLALILFVIIYFDSDSLPTAKANLQELSAQSERLAANIEYSAKLTEQYKALVAANDIIGTRLVHPRQLAQNLQYFYKLENDTKTKFIELRQVGVAPPAKGAPPRLYVPVGFTITVKGSYEGVIDVLRRLEEGAHYCQITGIDLGPVSRGGDSTDHTMTMRLTLDLEGQL